MIPTSQILREASKYPWTTSTSVDVMRGNIVLAPNIPVIDGGYSSNRNDVVRTGGSMTIGTTATQSYGINPTVTRLRVSRGVESLGFTERTLIGIWRVDDVSRTASGVTDVNFSDLGAYIVDARFFTPRVPDRTKTCTQLIRQLIIEAVPHARVKVRCTKDRPVELRSAWDKDRWQAINQLADAIDAEVYCNWQGVFVIEDAPDLLHGAPVFTLDEGDTGVLVGRTEKDTRDQVYNLVVAYSSASDPKSPKVWAWVSDNDPSSATYINGEFGQKPFFYSNPRFTTTAQCVKAAQKRLADRLAGHHSLSGSMLPLFFLQVGDMVKIRHLDRSVKIHLITKLSASLSGDSVMGFETMTTKVIARET